MAVETEGRRGASAPAGAGGRREGRESRVLLPPFGCRSTAAFFFP